MEQLEKELAELERVYSRNKRELYESYKNRNALANIGDIVTDGRAPILVANVELFISCGKASIVYSGNCVTPKFIEYKRYKKGYATQDYGFKVLKRKGGE